MKKRILWISTGGTFSCEKTEKGLSPASDTYFMNRIIENNSDLSDMADITLFPLMNIDSTEMDTEKIKQIASEIDKTIKNYDGIIVTHGTDTMAYTSALLSVMIENPPIPIVMTGSQKPYFSLDTDAKDNFRAAFIAACESELKSVCVVFDRQIFDGLDCYKAYSVDFSAFSAYDRKTGVIENGRVIISDYDRLSEGEYKFCPRICENIALIKLSPNFDESIIEHYIKNGTKGFVIEGYGTGGIPQRVLEKLKAAKGSNIPSMLITQCKSGGTDLPLYEVGNNAIDIGIIDGKKLGAEGALAIMMKKLG